MEKIKPLKNINLIVTKCCIIIFNIFLTMITFQASGQNKNDNKLFDACNFGDMKKVEKLISNGANVNFQTAFNETPLMVAIFRNNNNLARFLLEKGADPLIKSDCYFIKFRNKRKDGKFEVRVSKKQDGENALIMAIENNNDEIFNLIIKQDIDINFDYQPSASVYGYDISTLYQASNGFDNFSHKQGNIDITINGIKVTKSEANYNELVCIVNSEPFQTIKYTPLLAAIMAEKKNYSIIEKLAELSNLNYYKDFDFKFIEQLNDTKITEILKKYNLIK